MKKFVVIALAFAGFTPQSQAGDTYLRGYKTYGHTITVSCYRGPWKEVIWDRPEPVFVDSLVAAGYDYPTAHAMAGRICRDRTLVDNREALRGTAQGIVNTYPPSQRYEAPASTYRAPAHIYHAPAQIYGQQAPIMHSTPGGRVYYYYGQ